MYSLVIIEHFNDEFQMDIKCDFLAEKYYILI